MRLNHLAMGAPVDNLVDELTLSIFFHLQDEYMLAVPKVSSL